MRTFFEKNWKNFPKNEKDHEIADSSTMDQQKLTKNDNLIQKMLEKINFLLDIFVQKSQICHNLVQKY